jgi:hypothetical protein
VSFPGVTGTISNAARSDPTLQLRDIVGLHELKAAADVGAHPAADEREAIRHDAALVAETAIDRLRVLIAEGFDDHEQHPSAGVESSTS